MLSGLQTLFQNYVFSEDPRKLANVRLEDVDAFHAFTVLCLRHTLSVLTWRQKHRKFKLSDLFSISDEGLALVILENNAKVWKDKAYGVETSVATARYMMKAKDGSVRKTWSDEGRERYNEVCYQVRELRSFTLSKSNEEVLRTLWNQASRNNRTRDCVRHLYDDDEAPGRVGATRVYEMFEG